MPAAISRLITPGEVLAGPSVQTMRVRRTLGVRPETRPRDRWHRWVGRKEPPSTGASVFDIRARGAQKATRRTARIGRRDPDRAFRPHPLGPSERLAARKTLADAVPVRDPVLTQLPAELDELAVPVGEEVHQPGARIFELNSQLLQAGQRRDQ